MVFKIWFVIIKFVWFLGCSVWNRHDGWIWRKRICRYLSTWVIRVFVITVLSKMIHVNSTHTMGSHSVISQSSVTSAIFCDIATFCVSTIEYLNQSRPFFTFPLLMSCLSFVEAIPLLVQVINHPESRLKENGSPTENCISAVTKVCKYHSDVINVNEILPMWLPWLPITNDVEEAPHIYGYLCDLVEQ